MKLLIIILMAVSCATSNPTITPDKPIESVSNEARQQPDDIQTTSNLVLFSARELDMKNHVWLKPSIDCVHKVLNSKEFKDDLMAVKSFDYAPKELTGIDVLNRLNQAKTVSVRTYYKRFGSAIAYTYYDAKEIYLNTKWTRPVYDIVNTLTHELTHTIGFSHGDNYAYGKEKSVPYFVGDLASKQAKELCK